MTQPPSPPCPLCGAAGRADAGLKIHHPLLRCPSCGLLYSARIADPDAARYYEDDREGFFDRPYFDSPADVRIHPEYANYRDGLARVRKSFPGAAPRLLDAGCGTGALLQAAAELGFAPEGLEVSSVVASRARHRFKVHLYDGDPERLPAMEAFDVIVLWDVLEHLPDPVRALRRFSKLLKPGGRFLLRTIDEDCLLSQWSLALARCGVMAPARRMHEPYHLVYFDRGTLDLCLRQAGLEAVERWAGEFPVERVSRSAWVRLALRGAYLLQGLARRTYEQYAIAAKHD